MVLIIISIKKRRIGTKPILLYLITYANLFCSCEQETPILIQKDKTIIFYVVADNDLYNSSIEFMKQFEDFPDAENVNLLFVWATPDEMKLFRLEQDGLICIKEYGKSILSILKQCLVSYQI